MMRRSSGILISLVLLAGAAFIAAPAPSATAAALAATQNITVQDDPQAGGVFTPKTVTISVGDTVHWDWTAGNYNPHSVTADDGSFDEPPAPASKVSGTFDHQFNTPGSYAYYCRVHGSSGGVGMSGTIVVQAAATSTSTPPPAATDTPGPTNTPVTPSSTPNAAGTPVSTVTTAPALTPAAAVNAPASATPDSTAAAGGAMRLPRTGFGQSGDATPVWPTVAFAVGLLGLGCLFTRRALQPRR